MSARVDHSLERILAQTVFIRDHDVAFGELTTDDVHARAQELRAAVGWGPTARVAPVSLAWRELALLMQRNHATHVKQIDANLILAMAPRLWIVPPPGGLLWPR